MTTPGIDHTMQAQQFVGMLRKDSTTDAVDAVFDHWSDSKQFTVDDRRVIWQRVQMILSDSIDAGGISTNLDDWTRFRSPA